MKHTVIVTGRNLFVIFILLIILPILQSCQEHEENLNPNDKALQYATQTQKDWMNLKYGMFIHFGPNTYQMKAWGNGTYPANLLDFSKVDVAQWAQTAKAAGMKYAVLTVKHHDGFCLWNSGYTNYCMKSTSSPSIDVVKLFVDEFRKAGLKVGLYYSLWDRNNPTYYDPDDKKYIDFMKNQLTELLTNYGEITELWFDGAWDRDYPHACQDPILMALIGKTVLPVNDPNNQHELCWIYRDYYKTASPDSIDGQRWSWEEVYNHIHKLQPNCLVINNSSMNWKGGAKYLPLDIRTVEQFDLVVPSNFVNIYNDIEKYLYTDKNGYNVYLPLEFTTSITPSWFWTGDFLIHPSVDEIVGWFRKAQSYHGNFLLNVGPSIDGKIPSYNVDYLTKAGKILTDSGELK
jgi:alpha-L-fucosidase